VRALHYRHVRVVATDVIGKESTSFDDELAIVRGELVEDDEGAAVLHRISRVDALRAVAKDLPIAYLQQKTGFGKRKVEMLLYGQRKGNEEAWHAIADAAWFYLYLGCRTNVEAIALVREKRLVRERNRLVNEIQAASEVPTSRAEAPQERGGLAS
jgi:hypothetical protein